jgi:hypothetical protein
MKGILTVVPAYSHDAMQRLPLHWACVNPNPNHSKQRWIFRGQQYKMDVHNRIQVIQTLIQIYPHSVYMRDMHGKTPLDLALQYQMDPQIIQLLMKRSMPMQNKPSSSSPPCSRTAQESATDTLTTVVVPLEVTEREPDEEEHDEISSMGSGGVSRMHHPLYRLPTAPSISNRRFEPMSHQHHYPQNHHHHPKQQQHGHHQQRNVVPMFLEI